MAFTLPGCATDKIKGFHIYAAHSDSPSFKIKENPEITRENAYVVLNTEKYGGMILSTWLDRPLTIAGRVCIEEDGDIKTYPIKLKDNICMIPNLAIHMNRDMNDGVKLNPQTDMIPLITLSSDKEGEFSLKGLLAEELTILTKTRQNVDDILSYDLFVENSEKSTLAGANNEFIMSARYDDLACAYAGLKAISDTNPTEYINVLAIFDNEEVGSLTRQGADSTFLKDTLENIAETLGISRATYRTLIAESFLLSADNAHALHPNQVGKADPTNRPIINKGVVLKHHGSQKYSTDAYSSAYVKSLCKNKGIPLQTYANRSDIPGGSTLGNLAMAQVSMPAADIGLPQLAMHSAYETAGMQDIEYLIKLAETFFSK
jgi:aspartyl aminopeptidase